MAAIDRVVQHSPKPAQRMIGPARRCPAVLVEPAGHKRHVVIRSSGSDPKVGSNCALKTQRSTDFCVEGLHRSMHARPGPLTNSRNVGTAACSVGSNRALRLDDAALAARLPDARQRRRSERDPARSVGIAFRAIDEAPMPGGPDPYTEARLARVPDRILASVGASLAMPASVRRRLCAAMAYPSRAAPTASAASRTMESDRCVYFSVVAGSRCPRSRPMVSTVSPCAKAMLAYECAEDRGGGHRTGPLLLLRDARPARPPLRSESCPSGARGRSRLSCGASHRELRVRQTRARPCAAPSCYRAGTVLPRDRSAISERRSRPCGIR